MAFDQTTRNRLQRFVNDARRVLEEEFTRQLQNDYGMDPNAGSVAELTSLRHINDAQRETARILRDTLAHYTASGDMNAMQGLDRIVREQAFTVLNRLAALRMAEARGLLVESVGNGFQAKGFQLYARLAGTGLGETGDAYRVYLFSVFDELAQDLPGLFDRYSPQGRLFPREVALLQVLSLINDAEIAPLWSEDETIGWIYQYFNSREERRAMREASQAPRNSRELAVRNQFFTPRYVVEFLVDNTLGRLWFNATGGATGLRERCQYLLVKPDEQSWAITKLRDPRTLKLLDPACGSMHFGLYAFDLFAEIYREAWAWEQQHGPGSLDVSLQPNDALKPLSQTYDDEAAFLHDVPRLIIEHNIYGVDIDPRAAQIASLALWLRAQRAWHDAGVKAKDRPLIGRGHVVAAIAPPAERELRQQFAANLDQRDAEMFEKTLQLLKGLPELGVLLQVERELPHLIRQVYVGKGTGLFAEQEEENWQQAEARLREALIEFAQAAKSTYQGRLFAQDALQGLRLIDLCREVFDVVVMNPPFGEPSVHSEKLLEKSYTNWSGNLLCCFLERSLMIVRASGMVGCIFDRTAAVKSSYEDFRRYILNEKICSFLDTGWGVLDANVETACVSVSPVGSEKSVFIDVRNDKEKSAKLIELITEFKQHGELSGSLKEMASAHFNSFPNAIVGYDFPGYLIKAFEEGLSLASSGCVAFTGNQVSTARHYRLWWENSPVHPPFFVANLFNGEGFSPYWAKFRDIVISNVDLDELPRNSSTTLRNKAQHLKSGVCFGKRGEFFSAQFLPKGFYFSLEGLSIPSGDLKEIVQILAVLNTPLARFSINKFAGQHKTSGYVNLFPFRRISEASNFMPKIYGAAIALRRVQSYDETITLYDGFYSVNSVYDLAGDIENKVRLALSKVEEAERCSQELLFQEYGVSEVEGKEILNFKESQPTYARPLDDLDLNNGCKWFAAHALVSFWVGCSFGRWKDHSESEFGNSEKDLIEEHPRCPKIFKNPRDANSKLDINDNSAAVRGVLHSREVIDDLSMAVSGASAFIHGPATDTLESQTAFVLNSKRLSDYLKSLSGFFADHLKRYTKSGRASPIYWPLSTASGSYTLWVYYPSLTSQTLYTANNDFVEPKLKQVGADVTALRSKGSARTRDDEKQFEALQAFELELIELRDTLLKLAPAYRPNHDDGVQISAAPLWPLFRHKPWQKVLKDTWAKLEKGDYDWAHLAMNYWPERVREKCKADKSLAIAHGLEDLYVEPEAKPKKTRGKKQSGDL